MPSLRSKMSLEYDTTGYHTPTFFVMYDPGSGPPTPPTATATVTLMTSATAFSYKNTAVPATPDTEDPQGIIVIWDNQDLDPGVWKGYEFNLACIQSGTHSITGLAVEPNENWATGKSVNVTCP